MSLRRYAVLAFLSIFNGLIHLVEIDVLSPWDVEERALDVGVTRLFIVRV